MARTAPTAGLRTAILSLDLVPGERVSERGLEVTARRLAHPDPGGADAPGERGPHAAGGRGCRVTLIDLADVRAIMEIREAAEVAAARLRVERADDEELAALLALAELHRGCDDEETGLRDFSDFHLALVRLSRNQFLADGMDGALYQVVSNPLAGRPHPAVPV